MPEAFLRPRIPLITGNLTGKARGLGASSVIFTCHSISNFKNLRPNSPRNGNRQFSRGREGSGSGRTGDPQSGSPRPNRTVLWAASRALHVHRRPVLNCSPTGIRPFCDGHHIGGAKPALMLDPGYEGGGLPMCKISSLIVATALLLAAGIGGWTVLTTSNVAAKATTHSDGFSGPTHIGGHFSIPSVY